MLPFSDGGPGPTAEPCHAARGMWRPGVGGVNNSPASTIGRDAVVPARQPGTGGIMGGVSAPIPEVSIDQVPSDAVLLDVREDDEWAAGHAPGAVHVPMTQLADRLDDLPEDSPVYVICRSGGRSARVTAYLNQQGWDSVNVAGGMGAWARAGRPMEADGGAVPEVI